MKKIIEGELVQVGVAMLVCAGIRHVPVHLRLVYRWSGLFLNTECGCKRALGLLQKQKSEGVIFTANHEAHFPHLCSHFSGSLWTKKTQSFAIAIPHFQFSSQSSVDGYSCQRLSAVCSRLWAFYT